MDRFALRAANMLVGNDEGAAVLEAVFLGPELEFTADATVAVTGAELPPKLDGEDRRRLDHLRRQGRATGCRFDYLKTGARAYIAVSGGIDVPVVLGSPLDLRAGRARRPSRAARCRRATRCRSARAPQGPVVPCPRTCAGCPAIRPELRCCPASTGTASPSASGKQFFADTWKVAPEADRIGYRFKGGKPLEFVPREQPFGAGSDPSNIVDACYPYGSIQVPGGTEPIVLHRDAVSGGGYMMVGTVISADMDLIGQLQPHTPARFVEVTMDQALAARADRKAALARVRNHLGLA